jgi:hypothetical protein
LPAVADGAPGTTGTDVPRPAGQQPTAPLPRAPASWILSFS